MQDVLPELPDHLVKLGFELRGVQFLRTSRMPGVPELPAAMPEVNAHMADSAKRLILLRRLGIEKPRLLGRSGANQIFLRTVQDRMFMSVGWTFFLVVHRIYLHFCISFLIW